MNDLHQTINKALNPVRKLYRNTVADIAEEALSNYPDAEQEDERERFISESVEGSEWTIYTHVARVVPMVSDSDPEYEGTEPTGPEACAAACMMQDCREALARLVEEHAENTP